MSQEHRFTGYERATSNIRVGDKRVIAYHNTNVVVIDYLKRTVTFDTGGWETATTRRRMNQACGEYNLPFRAYIKDYGLYVEDRDGNVYGEFPVTLEF